MIQARRRRWGLVCSAATLLLAVVLLSQPQFGGYSPYEDPRPGGVAILLQSEHRPPVLGTPPLVGPDENELWAAEPAIGDPSEDGGGAPAGAEGGPVWYVVQPGDNLSVIASRYAVSVSDLWIANRLLNPHALQPGQSLLIPSGPDDVFGFDPASVNGDTAEDGETPQPAYHAVRSGENLWTIARIYGVTVGSISQTNGISASGLIRPGDLLEIPGAQRDGVSGAAARLSLEWPVFGTISSPFGMRNGKMHEGLDIAADRGTPIRAAAAGRVISAGWMGNYGNALIIDHGNGFSTLYAHCHKLLVSRGQRVEAGELIALVGSTGRSTGPHLHFEVILNGKRLDPLRYLLAS